jgi:hypothetical protein
MEAARILTQDQTAPFWGRNFNPHPEAPAALGTGGQHRTALNRVALSVPMPFEGKDRETLTAPPGAMLDLENGSVSWRDRGGRQVTYALTQVRPIDTYTPGELGGWLGGYRTDGYRHADKGSIQAIPVDKDTFKYRNFGLDFSHDTAVTRTDDESTPEEVGARTTVLTDTVEIHRLATFVPRFAEAQSRYSLARTGLMLIRRLIMLNRELAVWGPSGVLTTAGNWASGFSVDTSAGYQWGGASGVGANSDPFADLDDMINRSTVDINTFWLRRDAASYMLQHPSLQSWSRFKQGDAGVANAVSAVKEGRQVMDFTIGGVGDFKISNSKYRAPDASSVSHTFAADVIGLHLAEGIPTDGMDLATGYLFTRRDPISGTEWSTREVQVETRGSGGTLIIVQTGWCVKLVGTYAGGHREDVVQ